MPRRPVLDACSPSKMPCVTRPQAARSGPEPSIRPAAWNELPNRTSRPVIDIFPVFPAVPVFPAWPGPHATPSKPCRANGSLSSSGACPNRNSAQYQVNTSVSTLPSSTRERSTFRPASVACAPGGRSPSKPFLRPRPITWPPTVRPKRDEPRLLQRIVVEDDAPRPACGRS